jgi:exonuclease III
MKKFSKITNQKVGNESKNEIKIDEHTSTKFKILGLIDRLLRIRTYGPVDNRFLAGSVKIEGKEMLVEAIMDFLSELSNSEKKAVLLDLKRESSDWNIIDKKIDLLDKNEASLNNKIKFKSFLERWGDDNETLLMIAELNSTKMINKDTLDDYLLLIDESDLNSDTKFKLKSFYSKL